MSENLQIVLRETPEGVPEPSHFECVQAPMPAPAEGEVLVANRFLSLDPYMRIQMAGRHVSGSVGPGDVMRGETVAEVLESRVPEFSPGQLVRGFGGWQSHAALPAASLSAVPAVIDPPSLALSTLGMPGLTAYAGLIWQARPASGETLVVPAATGGVGAVVGQLGRIHGCRVVGIAGSEEKCRYAVSELGYDACINRRTEDIAARLDEFCPGGINIYFDLVGGDLLNTASARLAVGGRVILCGLMEDYNRAVRSPGPPPGDWIKARATVYGLVVYDFEPRRDEFVAACAAFVREGRLKTREDVTVGLEEAPAAFCRLMRGENNGKALVRLGH